MPQRRSVPPPEEVTWADRYRLGLGVLMVQPPGMARWNGPYVKKAVPSDPWDRAYHYRSPGESGRPYDLYSLGADGAPGGSGDARDITSWGGDTG